MDKSGDCIRQISLELVKWLLDQIPTAVNATNNYGRSPLHIAAINNNVEMCKILIDIGADVNTVMKLKGHFITPLDAALQKGYRGVAKYLLLHGAMPASRVSNSLNGKQTGQRCPSGRPNDRIADNNSPIESYEEWRARENNVDQSQSQPTNERANLPKLPSLVKNNSDDQHILETSSSTPSSLVENGHYKNVRQFETPLNNKPSNLKQAIITNVYVTNTPICHSKRVPPLKKVKKKRKTIQESEELRALRVYTPSISSSSSMINGEDNVKVVMETRDDSSFKLNDSSNEIPEEYSQLIMGDITTKDEVNDELDGTTEKKETKKVLDNNETNSVKNNNNIENQILNKHEEEIEDPIQIIDDAPNDQDFDKKKYDNDGTALGNGVINAKPVVSDKSETTSKKPSVNNKKIASEKSSHGQETKRSVSQRRGSVIDTKNVKTNENDAKQKTLNKTSDSSDQKSRDKSIEQKKPKKETQKISDSDKEKQIKEQRVRARKEFSNKVSKFNKRERSVESNKSVQRKDDKKSNDSNKPCGKQNNNHKDSKNVDSNTSVKEDNESKSEVSSTKGTISETNATYGSKIETKNTEQSKRENVESELQKFSDKNQLDAQQQDKVETKGEHEEYSEEWENDSELTVIDSQSREKSLLSLEEMESRKNSGPDSDELKSQLIDKIQSDLVKEENDAIKVKKCSISSTNSTQSKHIEKKTNEKAIDNNGNKANKSKKPNDINNNKVKKQIDNKSNKSTDLSKTKKEVEKKAVVKTKRNVDNNNNNNNKVEKDLSNTNGKVQKFSDSLEEKSHLSVSDINLNKTTEEKNEVISSLLRNAVSNQDINQIQYGDERPLTNLSSEDSIFDSALVMADMDGRDSLMHAKQALFVSPLDRTQSVSPVRGQTEFCTEHCRTLHKSESRCCHKLHFKTQPAHLGKVDVTHVGSRVDSRRDRRHTENVYKERARRMRRVRHSSDGYKSTDPNIITQTVEKSLRK